MKLSKCSIYLFMAMWFLFSCDLESPDDTGINTPLGRQVANASSVKITDGLWMETWGNDFSVQGSCETSGSECGPYSPFTCTGSGKFLTFTWTTYCEGSAQLGTLPNSCLDSRQQNTLYFHGEDLADNTSLAAEGFPIISQTTFDKNKYISIEVQATAYCGPNSSTSKCFMSLTLYNGETNYRSVAFDLKGNGTQAGLHYYSGGLCEVGPLRDSIGNPLMVTPSTQRLHRLRLDYYGHENNKKWVYFVDDIVRKIEHVSSDNSDNRGSLLENDPRAALFFAGFQYGDYVEGHVKELKVWVGDEGHIIAQQAQRGDGYAATESMWFAQQIDMGAASNISKLNLFLVNNKSYVIQAHLNDNGKPGVLVNATYYDAIHYGFQDVPLWVPNNHGKIWIVIKGVANNASDFGTSLEGTNLYPAGNMIYTTDRGAIWNPLNRDLYFQAFERK